MRIPAGRSTPVRPNRRRAVAAIGVALLTVSASACGGDAKQTGEVVIESEIADQIGLGELDATCDQPSERREGVEFTCTATTTAGDVIDFIAEFESDDRIFVYPTNVLLASEMGAVEADAAAVLGPEIGVEIDPSDVDCPDETTVLDAANQLRCVITDAATGDRYELTATLDDFVRDIGFQRRFYEVGATAG